MNPNGPVRIEFGCLADPIEDQLQRQGRYIPDPAEAERVSRLARSLNYVSIHGLIPDSARARALKKLMKMICKAARPLEGSA